MTRHWKRWLIAGIGLIIAAVVIGPWVYINFIEEEAPDKLTVGSAPTATGSGEAVSADGAWKVGSGSVAGYRVKEVLFGQSVEAVGRTSTVTGDLKIAGASVSEGSFTVDMASVKSDQDRRDNQFRTRIMDVAQFPTSTFTLTQPIDLGTVPAVGAKATAKATGKLTLKGVAKDVTFDVTTSRTGAGTFEASGQIPVTFTDYKISNPSLPSIKVEDDGQVEFLLKFTKS